MIMTAYVGPRFTALCALTAAMVWVGGCSSQGDMGPPQGGMGPPPQQQAEVGVVTLQAHSIALQSELPGRTTASLVADVRPQVSGILKARLFEEGAVVKAGQVLYRIDAAAYQASYDQAKADVANAEATVAAAKLKDERYGELLQIQGVSKQDADDAHATYQQGLATVALKKAALESARINLDYTRIRAPITGKIGKSNVTAGALVTANQDTALATIRALDPIYVDLTQSSAQLLRLRQLLGTRGTTPGDRRVRLKLEDGSQYAQVGTLQFQEVAVDQATGSVTLRAQFPNPHGLLLPGMYVRAVLDEAVQPAALLVPQQGISRDPNGEAFALVIGSGNRVERRAVVTERAVGNQWLISSGLKTGDQLIVEGLSKVHAGDAVRVVSVAADGSPADVRAAEADNTNSSLSAPDRGGQRF
jgi:membrane fusion protein, multidrug efflux system